MSLLARVSGLLRERGIAHAVIGAAALAVHGVSRATADLDLLALDPACLDAASWRSLADLGVRIELRHGDAEDPLAGVVRLEDGPVRSGKDPAASSTRLHATASLQSPVSMV